jgi:histone H3
MQHTEATESPLNLPEDEDALDENDGNPPFRIGIVADAPIKTNGVVRRTTGGKSKPPSIGVPQLPQTGRKGYVVQRKQVSSETFYNGGGKKVDQSENRAAGGRDKLKQKKPHRFKSGTVSVRDIRKLQRSTVLLCRKLPYERLVREIAGEYAEKANIETLHFKKDAIRALQEAGEDYIVEIFEDLSYLACKHGQKQEVSITDLDCVIDERRRHGTLIGGKLWRADIDMQKPFRTVRRCRNAKCANKRYTRGEYIEFTDHPPKYTERFCKTCISKNLDPRFPKGLPTASSSLRQPTFTQKN